jgi:hypothetical protein
VDPGDRDRLLAVIEARCRTGRNGATWQSDTLRHFEERRNLDRREALRQVLLRYVEHMHANLPVHEWHAEGG